MRGVKPAIAALVCGLAATLASGSAAVAGQFSLGDALFGQDGPKTPIVARYADDNGDSAFVLDRTGTPPLLRFDGSSEIWMLTPQPAAHGDIIYKNDAGEPVLRATRFGGMTLFTLAHPTGAAAALVGEAPALRPLAILTPNALLQHLAQASARASRAAQHLVVFDAPDVSPQTASLVADAATIAAAAVESIARDGKGRASLAGMSKVLLVPGKKAQAIFNQGVLKVVLTPGPGGSLDHEVAARPSSRKIAMALRR